MPSGQPKNLTSISDQPPEKARAIRSAGGKARAEQARQRKMLRETVAEILAAPAVINGKRITDPVTGKPLDDMQQALVFATLRSALKGDHKAAAKIVEWLGESNTAAGVTINVALGK